MSIKRGIGDTEFLKKRVPQNPKFQHIKSRLDTGRSLTKYMERMEEIKKNYRYRKDEMFKRLKVSTFAQLVLQVASVSDVDDCIMNDIPRTEDEETEPHGISDQLTSRSTKITEGTALDGEAAFSPRSTFQSLIRGVGELDLEKNGTSPTSVGMQSPEEHPYADCPYLLLDVRDRDLYDQCHIISAHSYPIATLSRTMNPYTKEVLNYRNVPGRIIILYDEDERIASQAATTMCERGFENLFMLSGGLKVIAQKFPEGLMTGSFPSTCLPSSMGSLGRRNGALHQESCPAEKKWRFTCEDLNKIQYHMEEGLISSETSSRLSSRMSSGSGSTARSSRLSSGSSRSQSSRPWK